jgi:hypothetical protein
MAAAVTRLRKQAAEDRECTCVVCDWKKHSQNACGHVVVVDRPVRAFAVAPDDATAVVVFEDGVAARIGSNGGMMVEWSKDDSGAERARSHHRSPVLTLSAADFPPGGFVDVVGTHEDAILLAADRRRVFVWPFSSSDDSRSSPRSVHTKCDRTRDPLCERR